MLPRLAGELPLPIPMPSFVGRPTEEYRWPFFGAPLLPGRELADAALDDAGRIALARPLGSFLRALHTTELDVDLPVDFNRRGDMAYRVPRAHERIAEVERHGLWRAPEEVATWLDEAAALPVPEPSVIAHGDLHFRHVLVDDDGAVSGVIDWGDVCRADPCIDLILYWTSLPLEGRATFLDEYGPVSDEQLLRARVLALFIAGALAVYGRHEGLADVEREAVASLRRTAEP